MADRYVIDTVAFIYYLTGILHGKAEKIFQSAEKGDMKLIIPSISIGEAIYVFKKQKKSRADEEISKMLENLGKCAYIEVKELELQDWKNVAVSNIPELHDRMVVAIARKYKVPLITNDSEIIRSGEVKTVWD
ncbi:MAG: PIN domain-containing protein [Candidatus Methanoperedens sp.]|nr:PIN domain-containing protein [Candidatus Methanoperedens sp.]MCZ7372693.1 PIN domain-containing protein [Candidatus Methanoperedens sp.]MCZ7398041.1 PIN domain-containing protein [Candidatus Methanoperedens sp.]